MAITTIDFKTSPDHRLDKGIVFRILHYWEIRKVVKWHKSTTHTDSPDGGCGKTYLGGGMHCPSASSCACFTSFRCVVCKKVANNCQRISNKIETICLLYFSERELAFTFAICCRLSVYRLSVCLSSVVCRLSVVGNARAPYSAIFLRHLVRWLSIDIHRQFYGDSPR